MRKKISKNFAVTFFFIDFILVNFAYFGMNYFKRGTFVLDLKYSKLLLLFYGTWLIVSLLSKKFYLSSYHDHKHTFLHIARSNLFILYIISVVIILQGLYAFSRLQLFGTCLVLFLLEFGVFTVFYFIYGKSNTNKHEKDSLEILKLNNISLPKILVDINLFSVSFFVLHYYKRNTFFISPEYEKLFMVVFAVWLILSLFTKKYKKITNRNVYYEITPYLKSFILATAVMSVAVFAFHMFFYSRLQIFGSFTLTLLLEIGLYYIYYISTSGSSGDHDIETIQEVNELIKQEDLPFELDKVDHRRNRKINSIKSKLKTNYLKDYFRLFKFIDSRINLLKFDKDDTIVLNTHTLFNVQSHDDHSASLFINLQKVNNVRWINRYFLEVHKKIYNGGFFIGCIDTNATHKKRFYKKYSKMIANIFYPANFFFKRVIPKLPWINKIYFVITKGKNRAISKAEALGRLYFCGFKVIDIKEIEESLYFIAQRVKNPSFEKNPSYGPTIKLQRIGLNAEILYVNKFRTMHPYSEFLQEYIYENNKLQENGKFKNDFRLTSWGQIFRKLWIDELPQIINYWRGDLNLVGVRALSKHYFDLYPDDLQDFRIQFKPGLIPPYYADMPKSFDEIVNSERKYLERKQIHPFSTDIEYFFKAFYNIFFKHARSQ